jgi:Zn-dependent metalloprotease
MHILLVSLIVVSSLLIPRESAGTTYELSQEARIALHNLKKQSNGSLEMIWNETTQTPQLLTGRLSLPSNHSPSWIVYEFLNKTKALYGFKKPNIDMSIIEENRSEQNRIYVRLEHMLFRTPVCGEELIVEMDHEGIIHRVEGHITPNLKKERLNRPMYAAYTAQQAVNKAAAFVHSQGDTASGHEVRACYLPNRKSVPLVYEVTLRVNDSVEPFRTVLVHSLTGRVIPQ